MPSKNLYPSHLTKSPRPQLMPPMHPIPLSTPKHMPRQLRRVRGRRPRCGLLLSRPLPPREDEEDADGEQYQEDERDADADAGFGAGAETAGGWGGGEGGAGLEWDDGDCCGLGYESWW